MKMSTSKAVSDNKEEDIGVKEKQSSRRVLIIQDCIWLLLWYWSSYNMAKKKKKLKQVVEPYRNNFREMKKQKITQIMMYFHKVTPQVPVSRAWSFTFSSYLYSAPRDSKTNTPAAPPPQPN